MGKEMRPDFIPFSFTKYFNHIFVKLAISFLLIGLAFRLLSSDSSSFSSVDTPLLTSVDSNNKSEPASLPVQEPLFNGGSANESSEYSQNDTEQCDLFTGDWLPDSSGPFYTNKSCHVIQDHQNCIRNGRPDAGYLYWRWNPRDCNLPRFNPEKFLKLMGNKSWAFIGDSIARNHVQSLLCILSQVEQAVEVYRDAEDKSKRWHFPSHNLTISVIWAPFLLKAAIFEDINGASNKEIQLNLDQLDEKLTEQFENFDYAVISGGKWYLKTAIYLENKKVIGCHYCPGKNLTELGFDYAYRKALQLVFNFVSDHKAAVFLRTTTPDHFENGEWFSGGTCNRTVPFKEGEIAISDVDKLMRSVELEEFEKTAARLSAKKTNLKLLDTTRLSLLRPDGHPGPYRHLHPFADDRNAKVQNDCLHWCLPGPIDSWNDLVMEMVINGRTSR